MKSTIRSKALRWLDSKFAEKRRPVHASTLHIPKNVWWLEIPLHEVKKPQTAQIHLLCLKPADANDFHYLKVPIGFFQKELRRLDVRAEKDVVSLFLSAEPGEMFVDKRGRGCVRFQAYEV